VFDAVLSTRSCKLEGITKTYIQQSVPRYVRVSSSFHVNIAGCMVLDDENSRLMWLWLSNNEPRQSTKVAENDFTHLGLHL